MKPWRIGRDLEQHAARRRPVDRTEAAAIDLLGRVQPLRRERADQFGLRCVVGKRKLVDATGALAAGEHGGPAMEVDRPRRARRLRGSAPRSRASALKHTTFIFFLGSRRTAVRWRTPRSR